MSDQDVMLDNPSTEPIVEQVEADDVKTAEVTQTEDKPADKTFTQAELDEIVQKRINKLERKMERQRIEAETRAKVTQELATKHETVPDEPKFEDFSDYKDFLKATAKYEAKQALINVEAEIKNNHEKKSYESEAQRVSERELETIEKGERKYDDFEDVVRGSKIKISQAAHLAMIESDIAEDLIYYLNHEKNATEAKRIADLPAYAQAKEIGKLEDKLLAKKPATPPKTPKPIDPIDGGAATVKDVEKMSIAEYRAMRAKQGAKWAN